VTVGPDEQKRSGRSRQATRPVAPHLADLAGRLSEHYDTRVRVDLGRRKGRITVEFATIDDLERIVEMMDPAGSSPNQHSETSPNQHSETSPNQHSDTSPDRHDDTSPDRQDDMSTDPHDDTSTYRHIDMST
jgi:hypothetical protein